MLHHRRAPHPADAAENSIMQTISIAVSAILIAAGLVTAPSLINNARDTNTKTDLANIALAQEAFIAESGSYASEVSDLSNERTKLSIASRPINVGLVSGADCFVAFGRSASGAVFYRTSETTRTDSVAKPWRATAPSGYPTGCAWPATEELAFPQAVENLWTNTRLQSGATGWASYTPTNRVTSGWATDLANPLNANTYRIKVNADIAESEAPYLGTYMKGHSGGNPILLEADKTYTFSAYVQVKSDTPIVFTPRTEWYTAADGSNIRKYTDIGTPVTVQPGQLTRISMSATARADALSPTTTFYATRSWKAGESIDMTGGMITTGSTLYAFADGSSPGWKWTGTPGMSASSGKAPVEK